MTDFSFYRDGFRVEPNWPDGQVLTDTGIQVGGVSPKAIVKDESGWLWMLKFEGADYDVATSKMAAAMRLPQPFVKAFNGTYIDKRGTKTRAIGTIHEWLDEAIQVGRVTDKSLTERIVVQRAFHSVLTHLVSDPDRHDGNEIVWWNDVFAIDRTRSLGWAGHFNWGTLAISSAVMNLVGPAPFERYLDRADRIDDAEWLDMAGPSGVTYAKDILNRKRSLRSKMVEGAKGRLTRVYNVETQAQWETFVRLNGE